MMISTDTLNQKKYNNLIEKMKISRAFIAIVVILLVFVIAGIIAFIIQYNEGLGVTGMSNRAFYGIYIVNFVFFIGISHAGTLISAILRVTGAEWRTPITRMAEAITVFALIVGAAMILVDMGRLDRMINVVLYMNITSPIIWDFLSISTYLSGSLLFLYLPLIPDLAILRDRESEKSGLKFYFYRILALGYRGTPSQHKKLERGISIMALLIIPIAVSVHTVVSWIFSMTWRPGWHSTVFGPYFVVGAIFSGIAALLLAMAIFRHVYKLHDFITDRHFKNLGLLLLAFAMMYLYFTVSEFLTAGYSNWEEDAELLHELFYGQFALFFWTFLIFGLIIPIFLLLFPKTQTVKGVVIASFMITIGMWLKRYIIVLPTVSSPVVSGGWVIYTPTIIELAISVSGFAFFILLYMLFSKIFPIVCVWEVAEQEENEMRNNKSFVHDNKYPDETYTTKKSVY